MRPNLFLVIVTLLAPSLLARDHKPKAVQREDLASYVQRMQQQSPDLRPASVGSLWTDNGRMASLATDYKAARVGDLLTILVVQDVSAQNAGSVSTSRSLSASSGITALANQFDTSPINNLFSPTSSQVLAGKSQAATSSSLRTTLSGRIAAVLPNGTLVVEAERQLTMNNEHQTVLLRGLVRPGDISPGNVVASNAIGNLQLELKGKGVLSDGTRPPNAIVRMILRIVGF